MVKLFGSTRDEWIADDPQGWLAPNRIFEGLPSALRLLLDRAEVYIVTTKQVPRVHRVSDLTFRI